MQAAVDFVARCLSASNARQIAEIEHQTGGVSIVQISQEDFDQLDPKDPNTLYFVYSGDNITQYMGDTKLTTGTLQNVNFVEVGVNSLIADIELSEVT